MQEAKSGGSFSKDKAVNSGHCREVREQEEDHEGEEGDSTLAWQPQVTGEFCGSRFNLLMAQSLPR